MPTVNELLDAAKAKLANFESNEIFLFRNLFKDYKLNRISRSYILLLGTLFLNYIKSNDMGVVPIVKISSGQRDINWKILIWELEARCKSYDIPTR